MEEKIEQLKLSEIMKNPYQPRLVFDENKLQELSHSIKENGVLQPIVVRKSALVGYELLAGERRFLASKMAGMETIPAIVRAYSDEKMMTLSILENLQRENLNPVEEARSLDILVKKLQMTHEEVGQRLGKSRSYVSNAIRILSLPQELLGLVEDGQLSLAHARTLLAEKNPIEQKRLALLVINEKMSVRQLEHLIYSPKKSEPAVSKKSVSIDKNIFIKATEEELKKTIGNTVKIKSNKVYKGSLTINFDSLDELEQLILQLIKNRQH